MSLYLEFEYIDKDNAGRKTGVGCEGETDRETMKLFNNARKFSSPIETCDFLLDLKKDDGDIIDTIGISKEVFRKISGTEPLSDEEYVELDTNFWQGIRRMLDDENLSMLIIG